jgi:hypothetical protein
MTQRIIKAIDIFLDAINEGTLAKGNCSACAVGNLVAHGLGGKVSIVNTGVGRYAKFEHPSDIWLDNSDWSNAFCTDGGHQIKIPRSFGNQEVIKNIEATDFTLEELMQIEFAFETNTEIRLREYYFRSPQDIRADQIKGLEAVVKVMLTFEDGVPATDEVVKEIFTNKANLIPIV